LGKSGGTIDVSAWGNLEMVVSFFVSALDDLSVNLDDDAPSGGQSILWSIASEIKLAWLSEVLKPLTWCAAVLADGDQLVLFNTLDGSIGATVEIVKLGVELRGSYGDAGLNSLVDKWNLVVDAALTVLDSKVGASDNLIGFDDLLGLEEKLTVEPIRDGNHLSVSLVGIWIQREDRSIPG
jgi:hypothetical protein